MGGEDFQISSLDIAKKYGKRHDHVLRDIDDFLKKNDGYEDDFILSKYLTSRGKCYRNYLLSDNAVYILESKFKYNVRSARFEYKCLNELKDFLDEISVEYIHQYSIDRYRIDLYIPEYNLAIEFDEDEHRFKQDYDADRQKYIEDKIGCKFLRIKEGVSCGLMIAMVAKELHINL